jgi:hypothetical protein
MEKNEKNIYTLSDERKKASETIEISLSKLYPSLKK